MYEHSAGLCMLGLWEAHLWATQESTAVLSDVCLWKAAAVGMLGIAFLAAPTLAPQNVFGGSLHGVNTVTSEPMSCISLMRLENLQHSHAWPGTQTNCCQALEQGQRLLSLVKPWAWPFLCHALAPGSPVMLVLADKRSAGSRMRIQICRRGWGLA